MDFCLTYGQSTASSLVTNWAQFFETNWDTLFGLMKNKLAKRSLNNVEDIDGTTFETFKEDNANYLS